MRIIETVFSRQYSFCNLQPHRVQKQTVSKRVLLHIVVLGGLFLLSGCKYIKSPIKIRGKKSRGEKVWEGSPFVQWESPKLTNSIVLRKQCKKGVFAYEGVYNSSNLFTTQKGLMIDLSEGKILWRKAMKPHFRNHISPYSSKVLIFPKRKKKKSVLVSWVEGDLFRAIDWLSGEDVWNRPACKFPVKYGNLIAGYCFDSITVLNRNDGSPIRSTRISIVPENMDGFGDGVIIIDKEKRIYYFDLKTQKLQPFNKKYILKHHKIVGTRLYLLYKEGHGYVLEMLKYLKNTRETRYNNNSRVKSVWKVSLSISPTSFWVHEQDDAVIVPMGLDCMSSRTVSSGMELWTSCGIFLLNPPAFDEFGMYVLSSREKKGNRSILFVDGDNGLQTTLFRKESGYGTETFRAVHLAPGKITNGLIYGIQNSTKILAIRISAPEKKEEKNGRK
jgi:hypothetical protein